LSTRLIENYDYSVVLYIDNNEKNVKFKKCVVKCYDFNEDLDNEKIVLQRNWFSHVETKLEFNKIYFIELTFKDGDFVQYTFNTKPLNSKIIYGEYHYNISGEGYSVIKLNDDGTYILSPFNYYSYYVIENEIVIDDTIKELSGNYGFEIIDGKEYLCLYMNDNQKMVFDFCSMAIFLDFDKTTYDFSIYHLEGNIEFDGGRTTFDFWN
jgi:hypothetical protein